MVLDLFADPDIQIPEEKYRVVDKYEWAITDQSKIGRLHTMWHKIDDYKIIPNKYKVGLSVLLNSKNYEIYISHFFAYAFKLFFQMEFEILLDGKFDFSKCRQITIRGYNKAGLYSTLSAEIKSCSAFDPVLIKPNIVIDAVGSLDPNRGIGMFFSFIYLFLFCPNFYS